MNPIVRNLVYPILFVVGCCLGSFFNVVIHRLPRNRSVVSPGSACPECGHAIAFYDNIPLLSYILLRGRCRHCKASISLRYPAVEALMGILTIGVYHQFGLGLSFGIFLFFTSLLLLIAFIDLDTYLIPDVLSLSGVVIGLVVSGVNPYVTWKESLAGVLLGGGLFYAVAAGYQILRKQDGLGGGDIKLLAMIGAFTGWKGVLFTVFFSSTVGAAVGLWVMARSKEGMAARVPFGPFLSLGAVCYLFWGERLVRWYWGLMGA